MKKSNESPEIQAKRREVNDAYKAGGVQSEAYKKSFDELHDMNQVVMANQFRAERGLPPNAETPYDPSPMDQWRAGAYNPKNPGPKELAQRDLYTESLRDVTSALNDGRSVTFAGNVVLPCKDSETGLRVHLINGASYPASSRDVFSMTIVPAPLVEVENSPGIPESQNSCSADLPANEPAPFSPSWQTEVDSYEKQLKSHIIMCIDSGWCFVYQKGPAEQVFRQGRESLASAASIDDKNARVIVLKDTLRQLVDAGLPHVNTMFASNNAMKIFSDARLCVDAANEHIDPVPTSLPSPRMKP